MYAKVEYDPDGLPKCEICHKSFNRIGSHVRHTHNMTAREYRILFGLDLKQCLNSKKSSKKSRMSVLKNYDVCIKINLLELNTHKFQKNYTAKKYISEQTRRRIIAQIAHTWKRSAQFDDKIEKLIPILKRIALSNNIFSEDVMQETLLTSITKWYSWNNSCSLLTWVFGIYKNKFEQHIHKDKFLTFCEDMSPYYNKLIDDSICLDTEEDVIRIDTSILTQREKEFVTLLYEGKKVREIAQILHNTPHSVKSYKYKLLSKLRERYYASYDKKAEIKKMKALCKVDPSYKPTKIILA